MFHATRDYLSSIFESSPKKESTIFQARPIHLSISAAFRICCDFLSFNQNMYQDSDRYKRTRGIIKSQQGRNA